VRAEFRFGALGALVREHSKAGNGALPEMTKSGPFEMAQPVEKASYCLTCLRAAGFALLEAFKN
jgi:hypothetical protein